jgi:hypothetical protein
MAPWKPAERGDADRLFRVVRSEGLVRPPFTPWSVRDPDMIAGRGGAIGARGRRGPRGDRRNVAVEADAAAAVLVVAEDMASRLTTEHPVCILGGGPVRRRSDPAEKIDHREGASPDSQLQGSRIGFG